METAIYDKILTFVYNNLTYYARFNAFYGKWRDEETGDSGNGWSIHLHSVKLNNNEGKALYGDIFNIALDECYKYLETVTV